MKTQLALFLCIAVPVAVSASDPTYKVKDDGGSLTDIKNGSEVHMSLSSKDVHFLQDNKEILVLPASAITEISYGQDVHRRVGAAIGVAVFTLGIGALMALTKSKKHFIGLTWDDGGKKGGIAFQANKNDYRGLLAGLEGITGQNAV